MYFIIRYPVQPPDPTKATMMSDAAIETILSHFDASIQAGTGSLGPVSYTHLTLPTILLV